jgi:uroporphyrinogen decarboxylase
MNHWERLAAAAAGKPTDRAPVSLWRHWPVDDQDAATLAARMVRWQRDYDFDFVKFMPAGTYGLEDYGAKTEWVPIRSGTRTVVRPAVDSAGQWTTLPRPDVRAGDFARQTEALRLAAAELKGEAPILQTVFSPLTTARKLAGDAVFEHLRAHPDRLEAGLAAVAEVTVEFCRASLRAGAHGLFFATQCATRQVMSEDEYARFGERWDRVVIDAVRGEARFLLLHVHGEDVFFERMARYPADLLSWHDRRGGPSIAEGGRTFGGVRVCGLDEHGTLMNGTPEAIRAEVADAMRQAAGTRQVLAPGCVCPIDLPPANLRLAVESARAWTG